jgi:DNA modification methylase
MTIDNIDNIADLTFDPRNARKRTPRSSGMIERSLQDVGAARSIVIDENGVILAGNGTVEAAGQIGIERVRVVEADGNEIIAVRRTGLTDQQKVALALFDNRTSELAEWDTEVLADLNAEFDLSPMWLEGEIAQWLDASEPQEENDSAVQDLLENGTEPRVKPGEIWQLGRHRLGCLDSTDPGAIAILLDGQIADLVITDPPYNVNYDPEARPSSFSENRLQNPLGTIEDDNMSDSAFREFLDSVYSRIDEALAPGCPIYIFHADTQGHHFRNAFVAQPWKLQSCLIWAKNNFAFGRSDYHWKHEPILYGWKEGAAHRYYGDRTQPTILEFASPHTAKAECDTDGSVHSCQKPTPLLRRLIENSSRPEDLIFEPFGGSGSTLIAAQQTNRTCFASEIDPRFADAIIARWEALTGEAATQVF